MMKILQRSLSRFGIIASFVLSVAMTAHPPKHVIGNWCHGAGIGICFTSMLNHIRYCELTNKTPVMYWGQDSAYYNHSGFNGVMDNVWEYYFAPVSSLKYVTGDRINPFIPDQIYWKFNYFDLTQENRDEAHQIIRKYVRFNHIVQQKIDIFYNTKMAGKKTIGIHLRGTDKVTEEIPLSPEQMVCEALKHADENTQFLLATDEQKLLDGMSALLMGRLVIYYDCYRSSNGGSLHGQRQSGPAHSQVGEDVLIEMALLSKCDYFIRTPSNISSIVLYFNPHMPFVTMVGAN